MTDTMNPMDLPGSPLPLTVSPADTFESPEPELDDVEIKEEDEKKPTKKRKSWGQELPTPKTNLPPRYIPPSIIINPAVLLLTAVENEPRQMTRRNNAASSEY